MVPLDRPRGDYGGRLLEVAMVTVGIGSILKRGLAGILSVNDGANRRGVDCGPGANPTTDSCRS